MREELFFIQTLQCSVCDDKEVEFYLVEGTAYCEHCDCRLKIPEERIEKAKARHKRMGILRLKGPVG